MAMALGSDGNLWFTEFDARKIGKITPLGAITEYTLPVADNIQPRAITAGPDGALWFTSGNEIGRITTSGTISVFPPKAGEIGDFTIVTGADHNLYYAGSGNGDGYIVQLTTAGVQTPYLAPANPGSSSFFAPTPLEVASASDGAIWFTETNAGSQGYIGRVTTSGTFSAYATPNDNTSTSIVADPYDKDLWFLLASTSGNNMSNIVRTTTGGAMTIVTNDLQFDDESSLIVGPDHNIWGSTPYTVYSLSETGSYCAVGTPTEGPGDGTAGDSGIRALTVGSDGNVWFLEPGSNLIGRFNLTSTSGSFARPRRR